MPRRLFWGLMASACLASPAFAAGRPTPAPSAALAVAPSAAPPLRRWEYRVLTYDRVAMFSDSEDDLRMLGLMGWELVGVTHDPNARTIVCFLKRPLRD